MVEGIRPVGGVFQPLPDPPVDELEAVRQEEFVQQIEADPVDGTEQGVRADEGEAEPIDDEHQEEIRLGLVGDTELSPREIEEDPRVQELKREMQLASLGLGTVYSELG